VKAVLRDIFLSLICLLDRFDGTPSEFIDAIDRDPRCARKARETLGFEMERRWRSRKSQCLWIRGHLVSGSSCTDRVSGFEGGHPAPRRSSRTKVLIWNHQGAHRKGPRCSSGIYEEMALILCKSTKALISTKVLMYTQGLSRFHRPPCVRPKHPAGGNQPAQGRCAIPRPILVGEKKVSREGEACEATAESVRIPILPRRVCNSRFGRSLTLWR
jgi:hypothetical protein